MGIRTGRQSLDGLRDGREVWCDGERVEDVTTDPRFTLRQQEFVGCDRKLNSTPWICSDGSNSGMIDGLGPGFDIKARISATILTPT